MRRLLILWAVFALAATACAQAPSGAASSASTGPQKITVGPETKGQLEAVLQKKATAVQRQDLTGYQSTIDLSRTTFRRCWQEAFDEYGRGSAPSWTTATRIVKIEPYLDTYVRAYVDEDNLGIARRYFRKDGDRWVLTEPRDEELGGDQKKTVDGVQLSYWGIDSDIVDIIGKEGVATRAFLQQHQRGDTRTPYALRIFPTRSAAGLQASCRVLGTAQINDPRDPYLRFFGVWLAPTLDQVSNDMRATMRHEGLHWLQDQFIPGISARLDWWLVEGWPDYVGGVDRTDSIKRGICGAAQVPTYKQLTDGASQGPDEKPEVQSLYYAYANSMIEYLYATYSKDAYWDLMTVYKAGVDPKVNLPAVLKVTPDEFRAGWLAFAKKKYC